MNASFFKGLSAQQAIQEVVYRISRLVCLGIAKLIFCLHVEGEEHVPQTGPAILAANHVSFVDPVIVGVAIRRPVCFLAKEELFRFRPLGWLLRQYHAIPVKRGRTDLQAIKRAVSTLQQGEMVVIFPEGTRGDGTRLQPAKPGIGLIAARSGAPVIPVLHRGTEKALPRGAWFPRPHRITVQFGAPLWFTAPRGSQWHEEVAAFSQTIMDRIAALHARPGGGASLSSDRAHVAGDAMPTETRGIRG